jgi:hypothetical protein
MTMYYTPHEDSILRERARQRGENPDEINLVLCNDGIYRTSDEKSAYDRAANSALMPFIGIR